MYPVKLGRVGNSMLSSEGAVEAKIRQLGGRVFFDPAIVLHHYIHAERLTHTWLRHRYFWQGISDLVARRYKESLGIEAGEVISLNMPLTPPSWNFAEARSPEKLEENFESFRALGFALAMTGILSVE
jgi:hypothetical protein